MFSSKSVLHGDMAIYHPMSHKLFRLSAQIKQLEPNDSTKPLLPSTNIHIDITLFTTQDSLVHVTSIKFGDSLYNVACKCCHVWFLITWDPKKLETLPITVAATETVLCNSKFECTEIGYLLVKRQENIFPQSERFISRDENKIVLF